MHNLRPKLADSNSKDFCATEQSQRLSGGMLRLLFRLFLLHQVSRSQAFAPRCDSSAFVARTRSHFPLHPALPSQPRDTAALFLRDSESGASDANGSDNGTTNAANKFGFFQRIESVKCLVIGAITGSLAFAPVSLVQDLLLEHAALAQWEFDTDMAAVQGGLFAIVYRYCIRQDSGNPQLNQGVVGAFVLVRTLGSITVPGYCTPAPLQCGDPFGYFDWNIIGQILVNGGESAAIFAATAAAVDKAMDKGWLSRFPG